MRGLCPGTPSKNKIGIPRSSLASLAARPGGPPCRFSSCSPSPGLADGQGFMRGVCAEPRNQRRETMSNRTNIAAASKNILFVPLCKLKKSPKNVRKLPHTKADIQAFAASIAALGMLQYPVVEPELGPRGKPTGNYLVNAGEGRRLAQLLRVKRKEIKADEPIRCILA